MSLLIKLAYRNVKNHWRQSLAALVSISIGFIAFALFDGYLLDAYRGLTDMNELLDMRGDVIIERQGASEPEGRSEPWDWALSADDQNKISNYLNEQKNQVQAYSRFLKIEGSIDTATTSFVFYGFGHDVSGGSLIRGHWHWNTYWGKPLVEQKDSSQFMIIGKRLAQYLGCLPDQIGDLSKYYFDLKLRPQDRPILCADKTFQLTAVTEKGQVNAIDKSVSGIYDHGFREFDERLVVLPIESAQNLFDTDKVNYYAVKLNEGVGVESFIQNFNNSFKDSSIKYNIQSWKEHPFGDVYRRTKSLLDVDRAFVISIIIFVGCLSVFNTLVKIIKERTFEIGMLRSLGFETSFIKKLFILESIFLSWMGCMVGSTITFVLSQIINKLEITYQSGLFSYDSPLLIELQWSTYCFGFIMMTSLSMFASFIAIRKPSQSVIAQTLIHS